MKTQYALTALALLALANAPLHAATISGTANGPNGSNDTWNNPANWSPAAVPSGTNAAVVASGIVAKVDNDATPSFSGGLLLHANAQLQVGWTTTRTANVNALGSGTITMRQGSAIISRAGLGTYTFNQPIVLEGDATIWAGISTANHGTTKTFAGGVSGPGQLTYNGVNGTWFVFNTDNAGWSGGFRSSDPQIQSHQVRADANGAFGTGAVAINTNCSLQVQAGLGDSIHDGAALYLNGAKSGNLSAKLVLNSGEVVNQLWIDGVQQPAGRYTSAESWLDGSGTLAVLENPGNGSIMALGITDPPDGDADVRLNDQLVAGFNHPVVLGSGNITLKNLTDGVDTVIPVGDPRITVDGYFLTINPGAAILWGKSYAVRIDPTAIDSDTGLSFAGITDDATWSFSTPANEPLLLAIAALKNHIIGAVTLTGAQIAAHKATIDNERQLFDANTTNISAVFDLISTYDSAKGPLFVSGSTVTGFSRNNTSPTSTTSISPENIHWVVYTVMQHAMDIIYNAENLANYASTLVNYKFGSHTDFPGPCPPPSDPSNSHAVAINGSFPITFGRATQHWTWPARKPTGTYLAPGTIATVTVPPALVNAGYNVRVGAHSWDLSGRTPVERLERATRLYPLDATTIQVASPYGGGIYLEVPIGANAGVVNVTVTGAVRSPYFSAKSFHQTTASQWDTEKTHVAPWADFQSDKFMIQVPRKWIYNMTGAQAVQLMVDWDKAMDAINSLMGFPLNRGKETMYCQVDIILRSSVHAPGYPAVNVSDNPNTDRGGYHNNYLVRGPGASPTAANIEFHEQGHAYFFPKFGGETESAVNLLQPAMLHRKFSYSLDVAQAGSLGSSSVHRSLDNTAVAWMCCFSFSPNETPMQQLEKQYQHKGHAKFLDIVRLFGWDGLDTFWRSYMEDDAAGISYANTDDEKLLRLSRHVGKDLRPLFHFWGVHPQNPSTLAASIAAANIPASVEIRDLLLRYKTLVPANNAAYQTFMLNWWGKKPSVAGYWEETDHAMQWDSTLDADGTNNPNVRPNGSIYVEASATEIRARVDELVALYFPLGMTPTTMSFATAPAVRNANTITMTATTVTAASPPVQYYFENTTNGTNSGWINTPTWQQTGLTPGSHSYRVKARNSFNTENEWSPVSTVILTVTGGDPFASWAGSGVAFGADANGDGVDNGMAWVLGAGNPSANAIPLLPTMDNSTDPDFFIFTYRRDDDANTDPKTAIKVEYGSMLSGWTTAVAGPDIIITPTNDFYAAGIDKVQVKIRRTLAVAGKLFARLHVQNTP